MIYDVLDTKCLICGKSKKKKGTKMFDDEIIQVFGVFLFIFLVILVFCELADVRGHNRRHNIKKCAERMMIADQKDKHPSYYHTKCKYFYKK